MDTSHEPPPAADGFPGPLTPEKVRRARERVAATHDRIRRRGIDLSQLPDPVEELIKAREAGYREQLPDGTIRDYRGDIYARAINLSYPSRRGSLFDMAYAALAEQAETTLWTIDERFYNGARAMGLAFVMHPGRDPLP